MKVTVVDASGAGLGEGLKTALTALGYADVQVTVAPASQEASQVFTQQDVAQAGALADLLNLPRLQGERFPVAAGEVGVLLTRDAQENLKELAALAGTPLAADPRVADDTALPGPSPNRCPPPLRQQLRRNSGAGRAGRAAGRPGRVSRVAFGAARPCTLTCCCAARRHAHPH